QGLAELFLAQGRAPEFQHALDQLKQDPRLAAEATLLQARGHVARREFAAARPLLEGLIAAAPAAVAPRRLLTQALLEDGSGKAATGRRPSRPCAACGRWPRGTPGAGAPWRCCCASRSGRPRPWPPAAPGWATARATPTCCCNRDCCCTGWANTPKPRPAW